MLSMRATEFYTQAPQLAAKAGASSGRGWLLQLARNFSGIGRGVSSPLETSRKRHRKPQKITEIGLQLRDSVSPHDSGSNLLAQEWHLCEPVRTPNGFSVLQKEFSRGSALKERQFFLPSRESSRVFCAKKLVLKLTDLTGMGAASLQAL